MKPLKLKKAELYRLLVEEVRDYAICFLDPEGRIVLWNKGGTRLEGYKKKDVIGKPVDIFFTEEDRLSGLPEKLLIKAREKGRVTDKGWSVRKDGSRFWSSIVLTAIYDDDKSLVGFTKLVHDLTEQDKERQDFKLLAESVPQLVWSADANGYASYFNQKWIAYSALQPSTLKGDGWMNLVHPEEQQKVKEKWAEAMAAKENCTEELRLRSKTGEYCWFLFRCVPIKDTAGNVVRWFGTATDIHKQKMEVENKTEFVSFATHELRMPLTTIKAYVALLERCRKDGNECDADKYLRKTHVLVDRLNTIISEMHEITKAESGQMLLEKKDFDLGSVVSEFSETIQQAHISHKIKVKDCINVQVNADKDKIIQVLSNYISNAIKYSPKGDKVVIRMEKKDSEVIVSVTDFGIGIPKYKKGRIFSKFYRAKNARKYEGLGLGLYLVKQIIHLHKGRVWMESEEGEGSTFFFSLPLDQQLPTPEQ